jgi:hypothetical protein
VNRIASPNITLSRIKYLSSLLVAGLLLTSTSTMAEQVSREQEIFNLRLGQRILVDDGSCAAGQIKEVSGTQMTANGILRAQKCVPRLKR